MEKGYTYEQFMRKFLPNYYAEKKEKEKQSLILEIEGEKGLEKYLNKKAADKIINELGKTIKSIKLN